MYLKSCCALFLLALVACQAAPSSQAIEKSINEAETMLTKSNIELEGTGAEKDRAKKSATTFCVEVRSGKTEKVPCKEIRQQETSKPVVIVQPISIPAPAPVPVPAPAPTIIECPKQPIVIQQQQPPRPVPHLIPPPVPIKSPPTPISVPCDKPIVQPTQPQIHTIHSCVIPTQQPSHKPQDPQQSIVQVPTVCKKCNKPIPKFPPGDAFAYPTDIFSPFEQRTDCEVGPYECNCRPENRIVEITPYKIKDSRMVNPDGATFGSPDTVPFNSIPHRSSMISTEYDPSISNIMLDQSMFLDSKGVRKAEERTHHKQKHYLPVNFNVQFPIAYGTGNTPYQPQYYPSYPSYPSPNSYIYPSSYGSYETYGTSYPINYDSLASSNNVPAVTVNAGGPFYNRESQHSDSSSRSNNEAQPRAFSTDIQSNHEQKEITQTNKESVIKEAIPEPNVITMK
ncbi:PREDICTED: uncharacterized protein LOC108772508 [Cyphomyrmex costatus]|uniref:uncharacterized protein LOC108772508 n=1 Tax=Cyphomyrmex costatus TaxID=456900 RepID=UPI0008523ECC|nr:PREDICTED: uncharacterized protein LOC108772508 [Cyphomyrmex costatus]